MLRVFVASCEKLDRVRLAAADDTEVIPPPRLYPIGVGPGFFSHKATKPLRTEDGTLAWLPGGMRALSVASPRGGSPCGAWT
jgi:hypothetical protein